MAARRRGFTIVELLVVIAIIGMLTAILLPAVGAARRAARMAQCQSNMRQVASAANTFHQRFNRFPGYNEKLRGGSRAFAWTVALLPDLDQNQLYERYRSWAQSSGSAQITPDMMPAISLFVCTEDTSEKRDGPGISYVVNAGRADRELRADGVFFDYANNGFFTSTEVIRDGATQTLMMSENLQATVWPAVSSKTSGSSIEQAPNSLAVWHNRIPDVLNNDQDMLMTINGGKGSGQPLQLNLVTARPSSGHSGGVNAAFCDTHVIYLAQDIDYRVYVQLMTSDSKGSKESLNEFRQYILNEADYSP